jgi:imidazolonepropionase
MGLPSKIHANELGLTGGVQVAVANGSWSADHLEHCSEVEIGLLRESMEMGYGGTVPVGLPGTSYFLGIPYAPGRALIAAGLPFAMATDFNPGSSPIASLQVVWALGCTQQKLLPAEGFCAVTCNAARALRCEKEVGALAVGPPARITVTKCLSMGVSSSNAIWICHASESFSVVFFFAIRYFYDNSMTIGGSCYGVCSEIPCLLGLSAPFC